MGTVTQVLLSGSHSGCATTTMRPFVLLLSLLARSQCGLARVGSADIVQGQGWAAPPPGYQLQAEVLSLSQPPRRHTPSGQTTKHRPDRNKPIKVISQFDTPNSFQPVKTFYNKDKYEPTTEQTFVSGPPLGDDFVERYQKMIRNSQKKSQLSFEGLLPDDLVERRKRKHQDPRVPAFYQIKSPVTLDFPSASFESFDFNPNGGWQGEKASGLAEVPKQNKIKRQPVTLDYVSPSSGTFSPNNNWFGEAETGLLTSYPNHLLPKRQTVSLSRPSHQTSRDNFSPSGWKVYRDQVVETGTRNSLYSSEEEPTVITLDNVADYLHRPGGRDVFDVNVQAVIKTRDSPNSNKQFYLDV